MEKITNPEKNIIETNIILSNKMFMKTDEAQSIANDIKHGSIVNINISDVSIKEDDLNIMIEAIKNNPHSIKNLRLHNCDIGDNQAKNIAEILKKSINANICICTKLLFKVFILYFIINIYMLMIR